MLQPTTEKIQMAMTLLSKLAIHGMKDTQTIIGIRSAILASNGITGSGHAPQILYKNKLHCENRLFLILPGLDFCM